MKIGLAMPNWSLGLISWIKIDENTLENLLTDLKYRCFINELDFIKIPKFKWSCTARCLKKWNFEYKYILADPYGITNRIGTQFKLNRNIVINYVKKALTQLLIHNKFIPVNIVCEVDDEMYTLLKDFTKVEKGITGELAKLIASMIEISKTKIPKKFKESCVKLKVEDEEFEIPIVNFVEVLESKVIELLKKDGLIQ